MKQERLPQSELDLYLKSLGDSLAEHGRLHPQIQLFGLPMEEWAGPGWNQIFLRGYALGYELHFGAVIKAAPGKLWKLRLSTVPPGNQYPA